MKRIISLILLLLCFNTAIAENTVISQVPFTTALLESSTAVDDGYFDDAVFIGDSLTLSIESRNLFKNATFIASVGASIGNAIDKPIFPYNGKNEKLMDILPKVNPKKIYILMGTNTLSFARSGDAVDFYAGLLDVIIKDYSDIPIYIVTIPTFRSHALKKIKQKHPDFSNKRIVDYNKRLVALAEERHCYVVDFSNALMAKKSIEPKGKFMAPDGIHLSLEGAELFKELLATHTKGE
ncbi:MAG: SGNH/GDSL hydrolase family protein [Eubacteriales bacterium]|nr:SGNH/GDSL hydrolase family protein [Eubacteriales bacterium]